MSRVYCSHRPPLPNINKIELLSGLHYRSTLETPKIIDLTGSDSQPSH